MNSFPAQQCGTTLVIALAILVIITLLAASSMYEAVLESRITNNVIGQTRLQNAAGSGLREDERRSVSTLYSSEPGTGYTADNVARPCLLSLVTLKLRLADTHQNPVGVLKDVVNTWMSCHGSDVTSAATAGTLCSVRRNDLPTLSGGQVDRVESPEYGSLMRGIDTFYYKTNSVARNQTNSEAVL